MGETKAEAKATAEATATLKTTLEGLLVAHDWFYERSDDYGVFVKGAEMELRIRWIAAQLPEGPAMVAEAKKKRGA